ncbi:hypothetical protein [Kitasatospora camelliae]|uniref:Type III secretion system (T3SS) SseB-like protein n=1 Tax=Kitasatospora camelliae TaxID=3156397 RepID=A0AAU8JU15_9ACTN
MNAHHPPAAHAEREPAPPAGPGEYLTIANRAVGVVGYLWASDAEGRCGFVRRHAAGSEGVAAAAAWTEALRILQDPPMPPSRVLAVIATRPGGDVPGTPGDRHLTNSLAGLESLAAHGWPVHPRTSIDPYGKSVEQLRAEDARRTATEAAAREEAGRQEVPLTREARLLARRRPGGRVPVYDPAHVEGDSDAGALGSWQVDHEGVPVRFLRNPGHRPGPRALGMPEPGSPAEAALQRLAAGYTVQDTVLRVLLDAPLIVRLAPQEPGLHLEADRNGLGEVSAYTSPALVPAGWQAHRQGTLTGRQIAAAAPGARLAVNPGCDPGLTLDASRLRRLELG